MIRDRLRGQRPAVRVSPPEPATSSTPAVLTTAVRQAARFDRTLVSPTAGLLAAIPVATVLGAGIAAGSPVSGVTMGAGAMLVGIAWRTRGGRPPLALMATDAVLMATSTFVGCVTGAVEWLHLAVLCGWSLMGGLLVALGPGGGVLGTQAVLAAIVFGRFSEPAAAALGLAGLVLAGGAAQVAFLALVRWPTPLRTQRAATATAYRALADLATATGDVSTLAAGAALDEAEASLAAPALLGDSALMTLRSLVNEGQRMRVQLAAIHSLVRQQRGAGHATDAATGALAAAAEELTRAAAAIGGDRAAAEALRRARDAAPPTGELGPALGDHGSGAGAFLSRRLAALAGQLRAVATLAPAAGAGGGLRSRRPLPRANRPLARLRADAAALRANMSLGSPAGRHALRLAVVVVIAEILARHVPLERTYWLVVAAGTTLRPEFGATFTRGAERLLGTVLGVALAGAITVGLHPAGGATTILVAVLGWAAYSVFTASFAAGFGFITALVVFLLNAISPDTLATAWARLIDTLVGGALGLIVYAVWPTWSDRSARAALADLIDAQRAYVAVVLGAVVAGERGSEDALRPLSRRARLARTRAESAVASSLAEPQARQIDADQARGALGAARRLVQAAHVLRLDIEEDRPRTPQPALGPLADGLDALLRAVEDALRTETVLAGPLPDLRAAYEAWARSAPGNAGAAGAGPFALDEIVDAANSIAAVLGLEPSETDGFPAPV